MDEDRVCRKMGPIWGTVKVGAQRVDLPGYVQPPTAQSSRATWSLPMSRRPFSAPHPRKPWRAPSWQGGLVLTREQDTGRAGGGPECSSRAPPARPSPDLSSPARPPPPGHLRALPTPGRGGFGQHWGGRGPGSAPGAASQGRGGGRGAGGVRRGGAGWEPGPTRAHRPRGDPGHGGRAWVDRPTSLGRCLVERSQGKTLPTGWPCLHARTAPGR